MKPGCVGGQLASMLLLRLLLLIGLVSPADARPTNASLVPLNVDLPSSSTGSAEGTLALRVFTPEAGHARYPEGAPVLIWLPGGFEGDKGLEHGLPAQADGLIVITFVFPGARDPHSGRVSAGTYDDRGPNCIQALRDVILYAAGALTDDQGQTLDDVVPVSVVHENVGLIGISNGGNILVSVAAEYGQELAGHLRYLIQWETPVSSQTATRDLGRVWLQPPAPRQEDFVNPRYIAYGPQTLAVDYGDLAYDPAGPLRQVFHDGNHDGHYTTIEHPQHHLQTPDLNLDGFLALDEDFPLDAYPSADKQVYSRAVTHALAERGIITGTWPADMATPAEADAYWDLRESVRLYARALTKLPALEGMVLCSVRDHVQSAPDKPHIRQAFEGWHRHGPWVQINPSREYLLGADPSLGSRIDLPRNWPNRAPEDWTNHAYCMPDDIGKPVYQYAAVLQMADRAQNRIRPTSAGGQRITYVHSSGIGRVAVRIEVPEIPRYAEGAPVVVEASTWFVTYQGFHRVNETTRIGATTVSYLWPERSEPDSGAFSEGVNDYGGPNALAVLRDVIRFASGQVPDIEGHYIGDLLAVRPLTTNVGIFASSHSGVVATNVLAHHGAEMPRVKYLVGRENPTRDEMYSLEIGYFDDQRHPIQNPFFDESVYSPITVSVDYTTVGWYQEDGLPGRPYHAAKDGLPEHILHPEIHAEMWGKRYYSRSITRALLENGALTMETWPADLATPAETEAYWPFRITVHNYAAFCTQAPNLKVMLVFSTDDHVQAARTKPHIHQAWDGFFHTAGLWVRMNPDLAYVQAINAGYGAGFPDNVANTEPSNWLYIRDWGFPAGPGTQEDVWLASVAEMADRVQMNNWQNNLDEVLVAYAPVAPSPTPEPSATPQPTELAQRLTLPLIWMQ